jgi:peptidoglycan-associated lipoprotein
MKTSWTPRLRRGLGLLLIALVALGSASCKRKLAGADEEALRQAAYADSLAMVAADSLAAAQEQLAAAAEAARAEELARMEAERLAAQRATEEARAQAIASLSPVYFDFDKAELKPEARAALSRYAEVLTQWGDLRLRLEGHCDENGSVDYNLALGDRRAEAVKAYLVRLGLPAERFETLSWGKSRPVALGRGEEAWARNRRCEFVVLR